MSTTALAEIAKKHAVRVAQGSGVLIQPRTNEFSYILTAKHVIQDYNDENIHELYVFDKVGNRITVLDIFSDSDGDLAILRVTFREDIPLGCYYGPPPPGTTVSIYGYPLNRLIPDNQYQEPSTYTLNLLDIRENNILEFTNNSAANMLEMEGYSGCGFYYFNTETHRVELIGIQNQMVNAEVIDGHIYGYSIERIHRIIERFSLERISPPYLTCFSNCANLILSDLTLSADDNLQIVKEYLNEILEHYGIYDSKVITPEAIIEHFKSELLSYSQIEIHLHQRDMWVWFFELLSIYLVISKPNKNETDWENSFLKKFFTKFRLVYTHKPTNHKRLYFEYIAFTDFSRLSSDTKIILFANGSKPSTAILDENLKRLPLDISVGRDRQQIDTARYNKKIKNLLIHWPKLNEICLADKEDIITSINIIDSPDILPELINEGYIGVLQNE